MAMFMELGLYDRLDPSINEMTKNSLKLAIKTKGVRFRIRNAEFAHGSRVSKEWMKNFLRKYGDAHWFPVSVRRMNGGEFWEIVLERHRTRKGEF